MALFCLVCGFHVPDGACFCPDCGTNQVVKLQFPPLCTSCSSKTSIWFDFCRVCGSKRNALPPPPKSVGTIDVDEAKEEEDDNDTAKRATAASKAQAVASRMGAGCGGLTGSLFVEADGVANAMNMPGAMKEKGGADVKTQLGDVRSEGYRAEVKSDDERDEEQAHAQEDDGCIGVKWQDKVVREGRKRHATGVAKEEHDCSHLDPAQVRMEEIVGMLYDDDGSARQSARQEWRRAEREAMLGEVHDLIDDFMDYDHEECQHLFSEALTDQGQTDGVGRPAKRRRGEARSRLSGDPLHYVAQHIAAWKAKRQQGVAVTKNSEIDELPVPFPSAPTPSVQPPSAPLTTVPWTKPPLPPLPLTAIPPSVPVEPSVMR